MLMKRKALKSETARTRAAQKHSEASAADTAYRVIKEEILSNRLRPGQLLEIEPVCRRLGLSRTPVREAILQLEREGFVEVRPRLGTVVSHLDLRQIQEMYQVRRLLEGAAARQAAGHLDRERLHALERELRSYDTTQSPDLRAISESGQKLHRLIVESCDNRVLAAMIESLHDHFRRFRALSLEIREKVLSSHREHLQIIEALDRGDGEEAERLIHAHFDRAVRYLLDSLLAHANPDMRVTIGS